VTDLLPSELARYEEVCRFGQDRLGPLAGTVAAAFADDPIWLWMYGSTATLDVEHILPLARAFVADTAPVDEIHGFRHHDALALWRAPIDQVTEAHVEWKRARSGRHWAELAAQLGDRMEHVREFGAAARAARPAEPHWYLQIIAVGPTRQGEGLGARVMAPMLERCDRLGLPTYLESSNPRNDAFYRRLGYEEVGQVAAAGSPPMTGFLRGPRSG
jgi:GNAT superfamily N-acetyltransferase